MRPDTKPKLAGGGEVERAQRLYDTLRKIARDYQSADQLRRNAERQYGLDFEEALEMAYDNIRQEAADAIRGMRRPMP